MKDTKRLVVQVGKRFGLLAIAPIAGVLGASALFVGTLIMWLLGFFVIPFGIVQQRVILGRDGFRFEPSLPKWASWWDDSFDLDVRGRPQATFVWNFDMSWTVATFVYLQFYNPLANLRVKFIKHHNAAQGRRD